MVQRPRVGLAGAIVAFVWLVTPVVASAQVLPLMVDATTEPPTAWWVLEEPALSSFDEVLLAALGERGVDPTADPHAPTLSSVYRVTDLSDSSAGNVGGLFDAAETILGRLEVVVVGPTAGGLHWAAQVSLEYRVLETASGLELIAGERWLVGEGVDAQAALANGRLQAARHLAERLDSLVRRRSAGTSRAAASAPTLVVHALPSARPLVAFMAQLREREDVVADLREVWATEGALAIEVVLRPGATPQALDRVLENLSLDSEWGYGLVIEGRDGLLTDVRLSLPLTRDASQRYQGGQ